MNNNDIRERILQLFSRSNAIALSYNELCNDLQLSKKEKALLSEILSSLIESGVLRKDKRKYRSVAKSPEASPTPQSSSLLEGTFDATPLSRDFSYAFVRTPDKDYYISAEDTNNAFHNDKVAFEAKYRRGRQEYGIISRIISRANETMAGDIIPMGSRWVFVCSNPKIHKWIEITDTAGANQGDKVILKVSNWGNPAMNIPPSGAITEILGKSGDPQVELMAVIRQYDLPLEFPLEVMQAVQLLPAELNSSHYHNRRDLRELFTFTIDPVSAKDFDDAISLESSPEGWKLYVHIADVAHYVPLDSIVFEEAAKRGNSFYFPKMVIPMLPEQISNKICSLRPEEEKLCMTVETIFNNKGRITGQQIYESVIRSNFRLAYEEVDEFFDKPDTAGSITDPALQSTLQQARILSRHLTDRRMAAGYIFFDLPELEYQYDEEGFVHRLNLAEETESHKLIENFMLIANEYVAFRLSQHAPHSIYRIHEDPDYSKLERVVTTLSNYGVKWVMHENLNKSVQYLLASFPTPQYHQVFDRILLRSMKKAKYSTDHISHFGLALQDYTHFTSPIRRLCDLVIHHLCKIYLLKSSDQHLDFTQVKHHAQVASDREILADNAERDIESVYSRAFMREKMGEKFTAMIISTASKGLIIRLQEIPVTGVIQIREFGMGPWSLDERAMRFTNRKTGAYFQLMDLLKVQLISVEDDVYFGFAGKPEVEKHIYDSKTTSDVRTKGKRNFDANPERKAVDTRGSKKSYGHTKRNSQSTKRKKK